MAASRSPGGVVSPEATRGLGGARSSALPAGAPPGAPQKRVRVPGHVPGGRVPVLPGRTLSR